MLPWQGCLAARDLLATLAALMAWVAGTGATECVKRAEVGDREGNLYECLDPDLPVCCETSSAFTCCESAFQRELSSQIWMLVTFISITLLILIACCCLTRQHECFESPSLKMSLLKIKTRITAKFSNKKQKSIDPNSEVVTFVNA